ncbi:MAG: TonB family protein [Pseudomonadota bacterium]
MNLNFITAAGIAALVTMTLILAMEGLVRLAPGITQDERPRYDLALATVRVDTDVLADEFETPDIPDPVEPPTNWQPPTVDNNQATLTVPRPPTPEKTGGTGHGLPTLSDNPLINIIRVSPQYPTSPLANALSGWVLVEFDVMTDGTVANARAIDSSHRVFERSALRAITKFKYKAPVIDGVPQVTQGLRFRFRFEVED